MPEFRRRVSALAVAFALVPAAAHAQGAGDDQYEDPFGDEQQQETTPAPTPAPTSAPPPVQPAATAPPSSTPAPENTLPYTGIDGWPVAIAGTLLLSAGLTLRKRLRADERA